MENNIHITIEQAQTILEVLEFHDSYEESFLEQYEIDLVNDILKLYPELNGYRLREMRGSWYLEG